jgi:hypothetical protein
MFLHSAAAYADDILNELPQEETDYLKALPENDLPMLHVSWGRGIRNGCGLWDPEHPLTTHWHKFPNERDLRDGVDYSVDHPDAVSMSIMKLVYAKVNA